MYVFIAACVHFSLYCSLFVCTSCCFPFVVGVLIFPLSPASFFFLSFQHHCRDGPATASVLKHAYPRFRRCLMMPNLNPPVTTTKLALEYRERILSAMKSNGQDPAMFQPLMTLYLTDKTTPEEIKKAAVLKNSDGTSTIVSCKYYPAGATTNSDFGVTDIRKLYPTLEAMQEVGMMLCIHSEVTHADIFDREPVFIEEIMKPLVEDFKTLKITM